jgi:Uma2 family endonuclease
MTVTVSAPHDAGSAWTIEDLDHTPDDGNRYEIADGRLVVSPAPAVRHGKANHRLGEALRRQAPAGIEVITVGLGVEMNRRRSLYIPDLLIVPSTSLEADRKNLPANEVLLAAEVLSPSNAGFDLVQKRHDYAAAGIPRYWIVDPQAKTITVLALPGGATVYKEEFVVRAGEPWQTDSPYPLTVDPAEIF